MAKMDKVKWAAMIITMAALASFILVYTIVYPGPGIIFIIAIFTLSTIVIAWILPAIGGLFMLAMGIFVIYSLLESNYDFIAELVAYVFSLVLIVSGFTHIFISWRNRRSLVKSNK